MFVSSIKVAILAVSGHEPFPDLCPEPLTLNYFTDLDQFARAKADIYIDCEFELNVSRISVLEQLLPGLVLVNAVSCLREELPNAFIRFNGWRGFKGGQVLEIASVSKIIPELVQLFANACGLTCISVPDQPGLVRPRVVAMIINEAFHALGEGVSTSEEIDTAMKLGTNYPYGPFEWAEIIGIRNIVGLLEKLALNDEKYQPATHMVAAVQKEQWQKY